MGYWKPTGIVVLAALTAYYFIGEDSTAPTYIDVEKMATPSNLSAFVVGGTGETGKAIIKALADSPQFSRVTLIGRRQVPLPTPEEDKAYDKFDEKIVDFDALQEEAFKGYDVGFCALGTTRAKAGAEGFYKVDHDYVVNSAKMAKVGGTKHFHLVSSAGAKKDAYFLYPRTKGEVEDELSQMGFERLSIYRPSLLLVPAGREETRVGEAILRKIIGPLDRGRWLSVDVPLLGKVIVANNFRPIESKVEILDNGFINKLGKDLK